MEVRELFIVKCSRCGRVYHFFDRNPQPAKNLDDKTGQLYMGTSCPECHNIDFIPLDKVLEDMMKYYPDSITVEEAENIKDRAEKAYREARKKGELEQVYKSKQNKEIKVLTKD
jgi:cytochrome c1